MPIPCGAAAQNCSQSTINAGAYFELTTAWTKAEGAFSLSPALRSCFEYSALLALNIGDLAGNPAGGRQAWLYIRQRQPLCGLRFRPARLGSPARERASPTRRHIFPGICAADKLVRTPWACARIPLIADALLRHGTLTGDEIGVMIAAAA